MSQWFSVGLKEGTGPQDVIPGVEDWGYPEEWQGQMVGLDLMNLLKYSPVYVWPEAN